MLLGRTEWHQNGIQMELQHKLIEITKRFTDKDIELHSHFIDDLDFDSLTAVELVMDIEEEFGIIIEEHEQEHLINVETTLQLIEQKIEETDNANIHS